MLDAALLRPGRFDRRVMVERPDRLGREQILGVSGVGKVWGMCDGMHLALPLARIANLTLLASHSKRQLLSPPNSTSRTCLSVTLLRNTSCAPHVPHTFPHIPLQVHIKRRSLPLSDDVSPSELAAMTTGFTGADLANLVNEAALLAGRKSKALVSVDSGLGGGVGLVKVRG